MGRDAGQRRDPPVRLDLEPGFLVSRLSRPSGHLDHGRHAYADERAVSVLAFPGLFAPSGIVGHFQGPVEHRVIVAGVVGKAGRRQVREIIGGDKVFSSHLHRVQTQLLGHQVHRPLHAKCRLRASRPPVSAGGRLVGNHSQHLDSRRGSLVGTDDAVTGPVGRSRCRVAEISPAVANDLETDAQYRSVILYGGFHIHRMSAAMEPQHVLLPVRHPLDGLAQLHRQVGHRQVFRKHATLLAKPAAHVGSDHTDLCFWEIQQAGNLPLHSMGPLSRGPDGQEIVFGLVVGDQSPRLHRHRRQPLHVVPLLHDPVGLGKGFIQVFALSVVVDAQRHVGAQLFMDRDGVGRSRLPWVQHHRQRLIVHLNQLQCVPCPAGVLGHQHRHRLPHVGNLPHGQGRMLRGVELVHLPLSAH